MHFLGKEQAVPQRGSTCISLSGKQQCLLLQTGVYAELGHLATPILLACRSTKRYRPDQSRQIHAAPTSDQPAKCELETLDAMSCLAPGCERSHNARQRRPQT